MPLRGRDYARKFERDAPADGADLRSLLFMWWRMALRLFQNAVYGFPNPIYELWDVIYEAGDIKYVSGDAIMGHGDQIYESLD